MSYGTILADVASIITIVSAVFAVVTKIYRIHNSIYMELWSVGFPEHVKDFMPPHYTIEGETPRKKRVDRLLAKLLLKHNNVHLVLLLGESGIGKSFLLAKVYHRLIIKAKFRGYHLRYVNAAMLESFQDLSDSSVSKKTILFLDGLDEYYQFLETHNSVERVELFKKLHKELKEYGRVVISSRTDFYLANVEGFSRLNVHLIDNEEQKTLKITLKGLDNEQIRKYLKYKMKLNALEIENCMALVRDSDRILGRPLFLRFLASLPAGEDYSNSYMIYEAIINCWMKRERKKSDAGTYPMEETELGRLFDRLTDLYFTRLTCGKASLYFREEEITDSKCGVCTPEIGVRSLLKYDEEKGYSCIHHSFFEFNYVRLHYNKMYKSGFKDKCFALNCLRKYYGECHYNRRFSLDFPEAKVIIRKVGEKPLSKLQADEVEKIIQVKVIRSKDLCHKGFQKFMVGLLYSTFLLGTWKVGNKQLRVIIQNRNLKLCNMKIRTVEELEWFRDFPICSLNISHTGINTLRFLQSFPVLERFISIGNRLRSLKGLEQCNGLRYLNLSNCWLESYMFKRTLPAALREMIISNNEIEELSFLASVQLEFLDVSDNPLMDGMETWMELPKRSRCVYHFESPRLKSYFSEADMADTSEVSYRDVMCTIKRNQSMWIPEKGITSLCGLENMNFSSVLIPFELIGLVSNMNRPIHTGTILSFPEKEYRLGYQLNYLFALLDDVRWGGIKSDNLFRLFKCCSEVLECIAFYKMEDEPVYNYWASTLKIMNELAIELCINEIIYLSIACLKRLHQNGDIAEGELSKINIYRVLPYYIERNSTIGSKFPGSLKELSKQYYKFKEKGEQFRKIQDMIFSKTKGLQAISWGDS